MLPVNRKYVSTHFMGSAEVGCSGFLSNPQVGTGKVCPMANFCSVGVASVSSQHVLLRSRCPKFSSTDRLECRYNLVLVCLFSPSLYTHILYVPRESLVLHFSILLNAIEIQNILHTNLIFQLTSIDI